jgi:hypothetical protein
MKYLPFEKLRFESNLKEEKIRQRLADHISLKTGRWTFRSDYDGKTYVGNLGTSDFEMSRIITQRNSFLPRIKGNFETNGSGTLITVRMRLSVFVGVFICIWMGLVGFSCLGVLISLISGSTFKPMMLSPFGMLVFGYLLTLLSFKYESRKSIKHFEEWFEAEAIQD